MAIKLADTLAPMADFPAAMAEHIAFADGKTLQEKVDSGDFAGGGEGGSVIVDTEVSDTSENPIQNKVIKKYVDDEIAKVPSGESVTVDTEVSDTSENPIQNKVIKKYVDNNLADVQTEFSEIKKELSDGMTVVADAITEKGVETATDATLEVMAANIRAIEVGVDTSDATATAIDIVAGKTAWVKGNKITGIASFSELHGAIISVSSANDTLIGNDITLSKDGIVVGSKTMDESLVCSFNGIQEVGKYVISATDGIQQNEVNVIITSDNVINKTVVAVSFNIRTWITRWIEAGRVTDSFSTLDEVFASEITVRQLMTIHASVNVLKEWMLADPSIVDTFVANATAMKWMGLRDYAYDTLTAGVDGLEEKILASENWEYALKDHVPVMTSNTAPYGESYASGRYNSVAEPYKAFDRVLNQATNSWISDQSSSTKYIQYRFVNPIRIRKVYISAWYEDTRLKGFKILASNDGTDWVELYAGTHKIQPNINVGANYNIPNDNYYLYYRLVCVSNYSSYSYAISELQFYGRALNVSVPKMTSNTAPYGEVTASTVYSSTYDAYKAFNGGNSSDDIWHSSVLFSPTWFWIGYRFINPIRVNILKFRVACGRPIAQIEVQGSFDGENWDSIYSDTHVYGPTTEGDDIEYTLNINNDTYYARYRLRGYVDQVVTGTYAMAIGGLQFYGVDYSEREFAEGSTMSYIYDHGVEFSDVAVGGTVTKNNNVIELSAANSFAVTDMDTTNYSLLRGETINSASGTNALICGSGLSNFITENMPNNHYLDVSSINGTNNTGVKQTAPGVFDLSAMWLE